MPIVGKNFSGQTDPPTGDETVFIKCNFSRPTPVERDGQMFPRWIWPGRVGACTFIQCNMVNARGPRDSTYEQCNTAIVERATRLEDVDDDGIPDGQDEIETETFHGRMRDDGTIQRPPQPRVTEERGERLADGEDTPRDIRRRIRQQVRDRMSR